MINLASFDKQQAFSHISKSTVLYFLTKIWTYRKESAGQARPGQAMQCVRSRMEELSNLNHILKTFRLRHHLKLCCIRRKSVSSWT